MTAAELKQINRDNARIVEHRRRARAALHAKRIELDRIADRRDDLRDRIRRGLWCLNLHLLDGFTRAELDRLREEVDRFTIDCRELSTWRISA